jgi:sugar-specific transcriptional regulator TrmB
MDVGSFIEAGMTKTEVRTYLEVAKFPNTTIGPVIKRTGLHRGTVYNTINSLIEKGFLSFTDKDGSRFYHISGEKIFDEIFQEKEKSIEKNKINIKKFLEEASEMTAGENQQEVEVFHGRTAFKTIFLSIYDECIKNNTEYLFMGRGGEMMEEVGEPFYVYTQKLKKQMKVKCRIILGEDTVNMRYQKFVFGSTRHLPTKIKGPVNFWIYGNNIVLVSFKSKPLTTIKIKSEPLAYSLKNYFEHLWEISRKIK